MTLGMAKFSTDVVWTQFSERLRSFIAKRVREENDVQDVLKDVFAKIHSGLRGLREDEKLEAWLFEVARHAILDHFRTRSGIRRAGELPDDLSEKIPPADVSAEVASWLEPMMGLLPEDDREAL